MKVLRLHGQGDLRLHEEPKPVAGPGEANLRVTSVGICASDLHWLEEGSIGDAKISHPLILGHEFAAVVEEDTTGQFVSGTRVAVDPAIPCEACEFCQRGHPNLCANLRFSGHGASDGALREYMAWPARCLFPIPAGLSDADGALLEPLGVSIHAVDLGHLKAGMTVAVIGCGPIGLLVIQVARLGGATRIIATDRLAHRLKAARALGADTAILAEGGKEAAQILDAAGRLGVDVVFEAAGEDEAVDVAFEAVRPGGRVVLIGIPASDRTSFSASVARRKGLTIAITRRMKHTYPRALQFVENNLVDVRSIVTHCYPLDQFEQAFSIAARREGIKVILEPKS